MQVLGEIIAFSKSSLSDSVAVLTALYDIFEKHGQTFNARCKQMQNHQ